jgi:hypothetical protein
MLYVIFLGYGTCGQSHDPFLVHAKRALGPAQKSVPAFGAVPNSEIEDEFPVVAKECALMRAVFFDLRSKFCGYLLDVTPLKWTSAQGSSPEPLTAALEEGQARVPISKFRKL